MKDNGAEWQSTPETLQANASGLKIHPICQFPALHASSKFRKSRIDPRLIFLHRPHSRLILFENGLMTLDEAVFGLFDDYCQRSRERRSN